MAMLDHKIKFIRFGIVGVLNTAIFYVVFFMLVGMNINLFVSSTAGYMVGLINSFLFNKFWTFKCPQKINFNQSVRFVLVYALALGVNLLTLYFLYYKIGMDKYWAQLFAIFISLTVSFIGCHTLVFSHKQQN